MYENVATDNSGHSIFLKLDTFFNIILPGIPSFDKKKIKYLSDLVYKNERQDNYTKFFGILYDDEKCANQIKELQTKYRLKIRLRKGEGYILNDRIWMHGRDKTNGGISSKRLHRLIYDDFQSSTPLTI